jgi:hypothetical protein
VAEFSFVSGRGRGTMTDENKMKTGRKPLYQPNQPVKLLISPVGMKNRPVEIEKTGKNFACPLKFRC